jgi:hypothetical protein
MDAVNGRVAPARTSQRGISIRSSQWIFRAFTKSPAYARDQRYLQPVFGNDTKRVINQMVRVDLLIVAKSAFSSGRNRTHDHQEILDQRYEAMLP